MRDTSAIPKRKKLNTFQAHGSNVIDVQQDYDLIFQKRRRKNEIRSNIDMLSQLTNDILVRVLSFVDMKTAGRTSILSKRWRYVWTYITDLDFSVAKSSTFGRYSKWVNNVTTLHRSRYLNSMRIHFPLHRTYDNKQIESELWEYLHKWINFGLKKKVAKFELNLAISTRHIHIQERDMSVLNMYQPNLTDSQTNWKSSYLKYLHLEALCIEGPLLENVLSNCLNLEHLTVKCCAFKSYNLGTAINIYWDLLYEDAKDLEFNIKISLSSLNLKKLEFDGCNIEKLTISAPKLTSLVLIPLCTSEIMPKVECTNVPSLVDVTFVSSYYFYASSLPLHQLEKLSLRWHRIYDDQFEYPELTVYDIISLIYACPSLRSFKLEVHFYEWTPREGGYVENGIRHENLEVIEIVGYDGSWSFKGLMNCLAIPKHTPNLKRIIIDPRNDYARARAKLLAYKISRRFVDMVIL